MGRASGFTPRMLDAPTLVSAIDEGARLRPVSTCPVEAPLASLAASLLTCRYHAWWGLSGVRYTTSIFPIDHAAADEGLPPFDAFVLISVARAGGASRLVDAVVVETDADRSAAVDSGVVRGASEWHVHLLAEGAWRRRAVVDDLLACHRPEVVASYPLEPGAWGAKRRTSAPRVASEMPSWSMCS